MKFSMPLRRTLKECMEPFSPFALHKCFAHCSSLHCHLSWLLTENHCLLKLAHVLRSLIWKKSGAPIFNFKCHFRGWIL